MFREVLEIRQKVLGIEHSSTVMGVGNLALLLEIQKRDEEAEQIFREVLEVMQKMLGMKHPSTLLGAKRLAVVLMYHRKYEEAEQIAQSIMTDHAREPNISVKSGLIEYEQWFDGSINCRLKFWILWCADGNTYVIDCDILCWSLQGTERESTCSYKI
jgi:hypothetical protein